MKITRMLHLLFAFLFISVLNAAANPPHIIFIMADDYGWANMGIHAPPEASKEVVTPTLDALISVGVELDRHYVYKFCSPSRCAFLTGRNPIHVNVVNEETNYDSGDQISGYAAVPLNMTMISAKLRQAGYATHYTGKWDAGYATVDHLPINRGFDSGFGYLQHANNYWTYKNGGAACNYIDLWRDHSPAYNDTNPANCSQANQTGCIYEDDRFTSHVLAELQAHDPSIPLFYYWAHHNIHEPLQVPDVYLQKFSFINDTERQTYAAMVNHMDDSIAKFIALLKSKGMWDNTLIVFSADNGGPVYRGGGANNYPLKGGKTSNWEGGIRVNAFASGGYLPKSVQGTKLESFLAIEDWYTTFCALAGVDPTDTVAKQAGLPPVDGVNLWPLLSGVNTTNPRTAIWIGNDVGNETVVQGIIIPPYKLLRNIVPEDFWQGPLFPNGTEHKRTEEHCGDLGCLFNILDDPTEHNNIRTQHPAIATQLRSEIALVQKTVFDPNRGPVDKAACQVARDVYKGFVGPFVNLPSTSEGVRLVVA